MPAPLSVDLRTRILHAVKHQGYTIRKAAEIFQVGYQSVFRLLKHEKETGSVEPKKGLKRGVKPNVEVHAEIQRLVEEHPDKTSKEMAAELGSVSPSTVRRVLGTLGFSKKKVVYIR